MTSRGRSRAVATVGVVAALCATVAGAAFAAQFTPWSTGQKIDTIAGNSSELNTAFVDGCPIQSPGGLSVYIASSRPGGMGGLDIWVARRASKNGPLGAPENLGAPINTAADEPARRPSAGTASSSSVERSWRV